MATTRPPTMARREKSTLIKASIRLPSVSNGQVLAEEWRSSDMSDGFMLFLRLLRSSFVFFSLVVFTGETAVVHIEQLTPRAKKVHAIVTHSPSVLAALLRLLACCGFLPYAWTRNGCQFDQNRFESFQMRQDAVIRVAAYPHREIITSQTAAQNVR